MTEKNGNAGAVTRRDFLKTSVNAGLMFTIGNYFVSSPEKAWGTINGAQPVDLAVVKGDCERAVSRAFDLLGGITRFVKQGQRVVIKPNMSFAKSPDEAANTSPQVVAAVAGACSQAGAKSVLIVDHTLQNGDLCLDRSGIRKACASIKNTHVLALNEKKFYQSVSVPRGKVITKLDIMDEVMRCDVLINLPTAKSHSATGVSLGMKGLMGLIWDRPYFHSRVDLDQAIADLASVVKPTLTMIDASRALITGGPSGPGKVERKDTLIAGVDPVAVDAYGVSIAQWYSKTFEPHNVAHIMAAHRMGLGTIDLGQLQIKKESV